MLNSAGMELALGEAGLALEAGEVPVGAAVADAEGNILALAHNQTGALADATAHASARSRINTDSRSRVDSVNFFESARPEIP